ncbi:MAG TPA: hypothetical protein PKE12_13345 [Kiritimatiellia bacterium]|nr:hypothetical protein [Kiritimatiellia bacterium]
MASKLLLSLLIACATAGAAEPVEFLNGSFTEGVDHWRVQLAGPYADEMPPDTIAMSWEKGLPQSAKADALCITVKPHKGEWVFCHYSGAIGMLNRVVEPGTRLRISFRVRGEGGAKRLGVSRLWGGSTDTVPVTSRWMKQHVDIMSDEHPIDELVFAPVALSAKSLQKVAPGIIYIDDLVVEVK